MITVKDSNEPQLQTAEEIRLAQMKVTQIHKYEMEYFYNLSF